MRGSTAMRRQTVGAPTASLRNAKGDDDDETDETKNYSSFRVSWKFPGSEVAPREKRTNSGFPANHSLLKALWRRRTSKPTIETPSLRETREELVVLRDRLVARRGERKGETEGGVKS